MVFLIGLILVVGFIFFARHLFYNEHRYGSTFGGEVLLRIAKFAAIIAFFVGFFMVASIFIV